ncbi:MAG: DbpA RNA binding domain-containing protein, partial [Myxococcota bacterium]
RAELEAIPSTEWETAADLAEALRGDAPPEELLHRALALLARERGLDLTAEPDEAPPAWAPQPRAAKPRREESRKRNGGGANWAKLFFGTGKGRGVRAGDVVGALTNELGVTAADIGRIAIFDHKTFVDVSPELAERILREHPTLAIRGFDTPISRARPTKRIPSKRPRGPERRPTGKGSHGTRPPKRWARKKKRPQ